jgi:hypothetical protein
MRKFAFLIRIKRLRHLALFAVIGVIFNVFFERMSLSARFYDS